MDDPRDILKAAGVEVPELDLDWVKVGEQRAYELGILHITPASTMYDSVAVDAAILALARLVAKSEADWKELRRQVKVYADGGIDLYQRENGKAFVAMMDRIREADHGSLLPT